MDKETKEVIDHLREDNERSHGRIYIKIESLIQKIESFNEQIDNILKRVQLETMMKKWTKWIAYGLVTIVVVLLGIIAGYSRLQYLDSKAASEMNINTYRMMARYQEQLDSIMKLQKDFLQFKNDATVFYDKEYSKQANWTRGVYDSLIIPNDVRSRKNEKEIYSLIPRVSKLEQQCNKN